MTTIQQDFSLSEIVNLLAKYGDTYISFNQQAINDDIDKFKGQLQQVKNGALSNRLVGIKNLSDIIMYLERLLKRTESNDKPIAISWRFDNNVIRSYPIEMKNIPEYGMYTTDYINLGTDQMISLDYSSLADIIAFEIMFKDLGEDHSSIEEKLKDVGIVTVTKCSAITKYFNESPYKLSKMLKISDSPYLVPGTENIIDYFGRTEFPAKEYRDVVSYSCKCVMAFIVEALLKKCSANKIKVSLCGVFETGIYLMTNKDVDKDELGEAIYVRVFGRKLEVVPKIQIF